jgi:predicted RNA binding protein YcfA (HicA-like mRNA interferase family)
MDAKDLIRELEAAGWSWHSTTGSHRHFKHPSKPGKVTVPYPRKDMHPKTVASIKKAAGL